LENNLEDFLEDCSKRCLTVTVVVSVRLWPATATFKCYPVHF